MENLVHIFFAGAEPGNRRSDGPAARQTAQPPPECLSPFLGWVLERSGVCPAIYRPSAIQRRVPACLRRLRVASVDGARELLGQRPELLSSVLNTALIGVTGFFRDAPVFDCLERVVLPRLLATRGRLRLCGAGVSSGEEIYSLAMLLAEAGVLEDSTLLGIDCRVDAIRRAQAGIFDAAAMAGVSPARRDRFFESTGTAQWQAKDVLKNRIRWRTQDVMTMGAGESWDVILFRNVGIYFTAPAAEQAVASLCARLAPGGFLITGKAEKPPGSLPLGRVAPSVYQKD